MGGGRVGQECARRNQSESQASYGWAKRIVACGEIEEKPTCGQRGREGEKEGGKESSFLKTPWLEVSDIYISVSISIYVYVYVYAYTPPHTRSYTCIYIHTRFCFFLTWASSSGFLYLQRLEHWPFKVCFSSRGDLQKKAEEADLTTKGTAPVGSVWGILTKEETWISCSFNMRWRWSTSPL